MSLLNKSSTELTIDKLATCVDENYNVESKVGSNWNTIMKVDIDLIDISKSTRSIHTKLYNELMTNNHFTLSIFM